LTQRAFGGNAPACLDRSGLRQRSRDSVYGRAFLGPRRAKQGPAPRRTATNLGGYQEDRCLHHPQRGRGGDARRPHHDHDRKSRKGKGAARRTVLAPPERVGVTSEAGIRRSRLSHLGATARGSAARTRKRGRRKFMSANAMGPNRFIGIITPVVLLGLWEVAAHF